MDVMSATKKITEEISAITQKEHETKERIRNLKNLIEQKKAREESLARLEKEEQELASLLEGI